MSSCRSAPSNRATPPPLPGSLAEASSEKELVLRSPDPFFSVAFPLAAGVAAETGSVLSHGAIAAREYRLPAVPAVAGLWDALVDGEPVEVDGTAGTVTRLAHDHTGREEVGDAVSGFLRPISAAGDLVRAAHAAGRFRQRLEVRGKSGEALTLRVVVYQAARNLPLSYPV